MFLSSESQHGSYSHGWSQICMYNDIQMLIFNNTIITNKIRKTGASAYHHKPFKRYYKLINSPFPRYGKHPVCVRGSEGHDPPVQSEGIQFGVRGARALSSRTTAHSNQKQAAEA